MAKRKKFEYRKPSKEAVQKRAKQSGGMYDNYLDPNLPIYQPGEGEIRIRILPPGWEDAEYFGYEIFVHYNVGPDDQTYLCLQKHGDGDCPVCEERQRAQAENDDDTADALRVVKRVLMWIIDRDKEDEGPKLWAMPWTLERDITSAMIDKDTGELLYIDDPEEGYDVDFRREGKPPRVKYTGVAIARRQSPLHRDEDKMDEWLDYITEHPLPDVLQVYDYEHIEKTLGGASKKEEKEEKDEEEEPRTRRSRRGKDKDEKDEKEQEEEQSPIEQEAEEKEEEEQSSSRRRRRGSSGEDKSSKDEKQEKDEEEEQSSSRRRRRRRS